MFSQITLIISENNFNMYQGRLLSFKVTKIQAMHVKSRHLETVLTLTQSPALMTDTCFTDLFLTEHQELAGLLDGLAYFSCVNKQLVFIWTQVL